MQLLLVRPEKRAVLMNLYRHADDIRYDTWKKNFAINESTAECSFIFVVQVARPQEMVTQDE